MATSMTDFYNHASPAPGVTFTAAAAATTAAGTIIPVLAGAGTGATTAIPTGATPNDTRGTFNLVTAGSPAAGVVATVFFANPYSQVPGAIQIGAFDTSGTPVGILCGVSGASQTGFSIVCGALTTAHTITFTYEVIA